MVLVRLNMRPRLLSISIDVLNVEFHRVPAGLRAHSIRLRRAFTQVQSTVNLVQSASRRRQRSSFLTAWVLVIRFIFLPVFRPLSDAFNHVLTVCVDMHWDWALNRLQGLDGSHQFHAVVGGLWLTTLQGLFVFTPTQNNAPTAGS